MKTFFSIIIVVIVLVVGGIFYFYNQVTYTPDWFENENKDSEDINKIIQSSDKVFTDLKSKLITGKEVEINNEELQAIILSNAKKRSPIDLGQVIKGINTKINEDNVRIETVLNIKNIPMEQIPKHMQSNYKKFLDVLPKNAFENIYLKFEGKPIIKNGYLTLDKNAIIQLGKIKYTISEFSEKFTGIVYNGNFIKIDLSPYSKLLLQEGYVKIAS